MIYMFKVGDGDGLDYSAVLKYNKGSKFHRGGLVIFSRFSKSSPLILFYEQDYEMR